MVLAIAGAYLLIATANGIDWASREPETKAFSIAMWEALYNGSACLTNILICQIYLMIRGRLRPLLLASAVPLLCFVGGIVWVLLAYSIIKLVGLPQWAQVKLSWIAVLFQGGLASGTTLFLVSGVYLGLEYWRQALIERENARKAMALTHQAQLEMLRYQLNPHFLFNALNSIRGMIIEDPQRSRDMVTELAEFLRYSLYGRGQEGTMAAELKAIESYLTIQRIRFDRHLDAVVSVEPSAQDANIPSFLIQPLVENAVKYGMETSPMPLQIRVDVARKDQNLSIRVSNSGRLVHRSRAAEGAGIGMKNIAERLELAFPDKHAFSLEERDGWVHACIELQLPSAERKNERAYSADR